MGEIDRVGAFVVRVYSNEPMFETPHVHVWRAGRWVKLSIPSDDASVRILGMSRSRMAPAHVLAAVRIVERNADAYLAAYQRIAEQRHGEKTDG